MIAIRIAGREAATAFLPVSIAAFLPTGAAAQGLPVETGSHTPVALWLIGVVILGGAIAYGIMRNRKRSRADKDLTDRATQANYRREDGNR